MISDSDSSLAIHLARTLSNSGWKTVLLHSSRSTVQESSSLSEEIDSVSLSESTELHLKQQLESIIDTYGPIGAFIHLNPLTVTDGEATEIIKRIFLIAKYLKKPLNEAAKNGRSWFVNVIRLDGNLGLSTRPIFNPILGGLFGLTKTLNLECDNVFCRTIDLHPELNIENSVSSILDELHDPNLLLTEVGYTLKERVTIINQDFSNKFEKLINLKNFQPDQELIFLVSGGARGITAKCVVELAKYYSCKFILIGRSELITEEEWSRGVSDEIELKKLAFSVLSSRWKKPSFPEINKLINEILATREITGTLEAIERMGRQAEYLSVDLTESTDLSQKLSPLIKRWGEIIGIIHGAGVLADKLIEQKTERDFDLVYSTKIDGLNNLLNQVDPRKLKYLILFSSAAGFYGNIGQSDYAIANEILNKFAYTFKYQHPNCKVISFNWGPWDSGMVKPELKQLFQQRGIEVIPVKVGSKFFANQIIFNNSNSNEIQVLVGNSLVKPSSLVSSNLNSYRIKRKLSLKANPFLQDHVIGNHAVLPVVFALTWLVNVAEQIYPGYTFFSCQNFKVLKGIVFDETVADEYILDFQEIDKFPEKSINLSAKIWSKTKDGKIRYHYQSAIQLLKNMPELPIYQSFDHQQDELFLDRSPYNDGTLFHGFGFQGIKRILNNSDKKITMEYVLPEIDKKYWGQFPVQSFNPIAADIPFQCMLIWVRYFYEAASLPISCQKGEHFKMIPHNKVFYVSLEVQYSDSTKLIADIISHDERGYVYSKVSKAEVIISKQLNKFFTLSKD